MNFRLAWHIAWRGMLAHLGVSLATMAGIAIGMLVIAAILVVDANSTEQPPLPVLPEQLTAKPTTEDNPSDKSTRPPPQIMRIDFERAGEAAPTSPLLPSQEGSAGAGLTADSPPLRRGEEDYQAMRLAVRLASLLAFSMGAVIVFYTLRFSLASRTRELCLLLCLGEERRTLVLSLLLEALALGGLGSLLGLALALPAAGALLNAGISTTGREPDAVFSLPWLELGLMSALGLLIALLGVLGPARSLLKLRVAEVLQPRFVALEQDLRTLSPAGFAWLLPPLAGAGWVALRPFVQDWLSVVQFFLLEALVLLAIGMALLWWTRPLLHAGIRAMERLLSPLLPLESLLAGRRMRLDSHKLVFTIASVILVFSLLTALHDITRALKQETLDWADEAMLDYVYFTRGESLGAKEDAFLKQLKRRRIELLRLSDKVKGEFPFRLVHPDDIGRMRDRLGLPPLGPNQFIASRTLAARFDIAPGDRLVVSTSDLVYRFELLEISDAMGLFAEDGQYVDLKSFALFTPHSPMFSSALLATLGDYAMARKIDGSTISWPEIHRFLPYYLFEKRGSNLAIWQYSEIDRDFLIFDFVLLMTVLLAAIGVANSILIQVLSRSREFAVFRSLGMSRRQTVRLLMTEGAVIGGVSALLALVLGNLIGAVSIDFLDRFTLFEYQLHLSWIASLAISLLAVLTCMLAAIYPALAANRVSSAESLHYE